MTALGQLTRVLAVALTLLAPVSFALLAEETRARLSLALSSPSGKLTYSPEIIIPDPTDPTAILLQSNAITNLSQKLRKSKTNAAFIKSSLTALQTFTTEQETARGSFPGPVPAIYYCSDSLEREYLSEVAQAGAEGVSIPVCSGKEVESVDQVAADAAFRDACKAALDCGLQPVPEVVIGQETALKWSEDDVTSLVDKLCETMGAEPVCVLLSVSPSDDDDDGEEEKESEPVPLPMVPKALGKKIPILGSVRAMAGDGKLGAECQRFKDAGFSGAFLRSECLPGFRVQLNLEIIADFWGHCISDLKSVKSKSFAFRSKNNMEKSQATVWANYQKSVLDSGALGDPDDAYSIVDHAAGEYKGFA